MLFGDVPGIPQLLEHLPREQIVGVVAASIRPQYHAALKRISEQIGVPLLIQPRIEEAGYAEFRDAVASLNPDLIWVNSYSMIVRDDVMCLARLGGINIHAALLPKYRGCNPIQWAIINGERYAGVTLHEMTSGLDEGPIIDQRTVPVLFEDTWLTVRDRVKTATDDLIRSNLQNVLSGQWSKANQDDARASYGRRRTKEDGEFSWQDSVLSICNKIRALLPPLPPAYYLSEQGERIEQRRFMTPMAIAGQKYGSTGGRALAGMRVRLRPPQANDVGLIEEWKLHPEAILVGSPFASLSRCSEEAMQHFLEVQTDAVIFVIEDLSSLAVLGAVMLGEINWHHRHAEMYVFIVVGSKHIAKDVTRPNVTDLTPYGGKHGLKLGVIQQALPVQVVLVNVVLKVLTVCSTVVAPGVYGLGGVLQRFIGLLLLPLFTRELSPGEYGVIALISLLSIALTGIFNLGTGNSMGILYFREPAGRRRASIIWSTFALLAGNSMVIYGVAYLAAPQLSMWMFQTAAHEDLVRLGLLGLAFGTMAEPWLAYLRMEERGVQYVSITIAVSLITAGLSAWMLLVEHRGVSGFLAAGVLGQAILLLLSWAAVGRRLPFGVDRTLFSPLVRIGFPSIWGLFAFMLIDYADRQMIERMLGLDALGIYSVGYSFGMVMMVAVGAFSSAWSPFFMSYVNRQHEAGPVFARVMTYYVLGFGSLVLLFFLAAKPVAHILTDSAFHDAHLIVGLVAAAYALKGSYLIALPGVYFANKLALQSMIEWTAALLNISLNLWLLPRYGIVGGALATFLSYLSLPILACLVSRNYLTVGYEWSRIIPGVAAVAVSCALGAWVSSVAALEMAGLVMVNLLIFAAFVVLTGSLLTTKSERAWMRAKLKV